MVISTTEEVQPLEGCLNVLEACFIMETLNIHSQKYEINPHVPIN